MSNEIIKDGNGKAWPTQAKAFAHLVKNQLMAYSVVQKIEGWVLELTTAVSQSVAEVAEIETAMTYSKVIFMPKMNEYDEEQVTASVNGKVLVFCRGVETIAPDCHLDVITNASYNSNKFDGKITTVTGKIARFAFSRLGEATKKEYDTFLKAGTKQMFKEVAEKRD
tara:strand:- start:415 stop:915 length:501 start_codon:yes stop_codon:yes gene_type:complete